MKISLAIKSIVPKFNNKLINNSAWSILSNILQNLLLSIFFIIIARQYDKVDFANYIIANTIYSFILGFSTLGLGYWFIREMINTNEKKTLLHKFFKMQLYTGVLFYFVSVFISFVLYDDKVIRSLSVIIGINIIFDNLIYVIKYLNIAELQQKKSFILLTIEAFLKFLIACGLFFYHIPIEALVLILITLRLITLNLFIKYGSSNEFSLLEIISVKINFKEIKNIVGQNWSFVVIGSLSVVNWRIGNIFVSKYLSVDDVANYEISFKLLSIAYILPVIVSSTVYPMLLNAYKESLEKMKAIYIKAFLPFCLFGLLAFTFVYSFADNIIPYIFGDKFLDTSKYCKEMFLVMLIFPSVLLQANVIITLKHEKLDMLCNIISLFINVLLCSVGLYYFKSLSVINYAIVSSFFVFHIIQDVILVRKKIAEISHVLGFYIATIFALSSYYFLSEKINNGYLFFIVWVIIGIAVIGRRIISNKKSNKNQ